MNHLQSFRLSRFVLLVIIAALSLTLGYQIGGWVSTIKLAGEQSAETRASAIDGVVW